MSKMTYKILPEDEEVMNTFFLLKEQGKFKDAFEVLARIEEKYRENYVVFFLLGLVLYQDQEFKKSIQYLQKAIQLNPNHSLSSITLIHALSQINKWHMAIKELRRFLLDINEKKVEEHVLLFEELIENVNNFSTSERAAIEKLRKELGK
jgi:tetratricopeptide (TPR) repeat protein